MSLFVTNLHPMPLNTGCLYGDGSIKIFAGESAEDESALLAFKSAEFESELQIVSPLLRVYVWQMSMLTNCLSKEISRWTCTIHITSNVIKTFCLVNHDWTNFLQLPINRWILDDSCIATRQIFI